MFINETQPSSGFSNVALAASGFSGEPLAGGGDRIATFGTARFGTARFGQSTHGIEWNKGILASSTPNDESSQSPGFNSVEAIP